MSPQIPSFATVSGPELLALVARLAANEREATVTLVAALGEMDVRKLHVREGYSSLFAFCTGRLHLSEAAACRRIEAARVSRQFPVVLERLADGSLTLAAIGLLSKLLTPQNHVAVLDAARHRSKREVEELAARLAPRPDVRSFVRKLPSPAGLRAEPGGGGTGGYPGEARNRPGSPSARLCAEEQACVPGSAEERSRPLDAPTAAGTHASAAAAALPLLDGSAGAGGVPRDDDRPIPVAAPSPARPVVRPLAPGRYSIQVTVSAETHAKLLRARDLLRQAIPSGDAALIVDRALTVLVAQLEKAKFALVAPAADGEAPAGHVVAGQDGAARAVAAGIAAESPRRGRGVAGGTTRSRYIPAAVRREVWARSGGRCEFVGEGGQRCEQRGFLQFHHRVPFAAGGASRASNLSVYCRVHNLCEAETYFGAEFMAERRRVGLSTSAAGTPGTDPDGVTPTAPVVSPSLATVNSRREAGGAEHHGSPDGEPHSRGSGQAR